MEFRMLTEVRSERARKIRKKMMKKGRDWCPRRGKELVPRKDQLANTLTTGPKDVNRLVLVIPRSINSRTRSTKSTSARTKIMETQEKLTQKNWRILICWLADSLAKLSASLENVADLKTREAHCSLKLLGLLKKNVHAFYYLKTLKGCYLTMAGKRMEQSSIRWMNWGMTLNGRCLTARISESPRTGNECSLSDVLEETVDEKYFLSEQIQQRLKLNFLGQQKVKTALGMEKET